MTKLVKLGKLTLIAHHPSRQPPRSPILFVHGFLAGGWVFDRYLAYFSGCGYPSFALNLRGRGGSLLDGPLGHVSMTDYVEDAAAAAAWLHRPIVVGHSMGGLIAQKLAELDGVRAAVLMSPAPPRGIVLTSARLLVKQLKYLPAIMLSRPIVPHLGDSVDLVLNRVPENKRRGIFERFVPDSGRVARELSLGSVSVDKRRVRCPILTIAGDDDHFTPLRVVQRVAARYDSPLHVAAGHGHMLMQEPHWEVTATFIAQWLDRAVPAGTESGR
jgi:pimeloyl-ACP methyl ester carboxylesterase